MSGSQDSVRAAVERALRLSLVLDDDEYERVASRICAEIVRAPDYLMVRKALGECPSRVLRITELHGAILARLLRVVQRLVGVGPCACHLCTMFPK